MPEWLIERGIGETRYALIENGDIIEGRVLLEGIVPAGTYLEAKLKSVGRNAIAVADGVEYLLPRGSQRATEGASVSIQVIRESLGGMEPWKRPLARMPDHSPGPDPVPDGRAVDGFPQAAWEDLQEEARSGIVTFAGGELRVAVTAAMTVIDIDGYLPTADLTLAGALAVVRVIRRHGISGSIGIDFPSGTDKVARFGAASAIDVGLPGLFERTAINGFGFMQIVRPRRHASTLELALDRAPFEARALLRQAGREIGATRLAAHPAVVGVLEANPGWIEQLSRQVGGTVTLRSDPSLAMSAGHAEPA